MDDKEVCVICHNSLLVGETVRVEKGLSNLLDCSKRRGDEVWKQLEKNCNVEVHKSCRKQYTRESSIVASVKSAKVSSQLSLSHSFSPVKKKLRSADDGEFDFKINCLFCDKLCCEEEEKKKSQARRQKVVSVQTLRFRESVLEVCDQRKDDWAKRVGSRVNSVLCLPAVEAKYHQSCYRDFLHCIPGTSERGRPNKPEQSAAFLRLCERIEAHDECQYGLSELQDMMGENAYSDIWLKTKLQERYGDRIIISCHKNVGTCVSFRSFGNRILTHNWYNEKDSNEENERLRIVRTAAEIVRDDIRSCVYEVDKYPSVSNIQNSAAESVPETLNVFLKEVIMKNKKGTSLEKLSRKCTTIAHIIIAATRPRSFLSEILHGISIYLHRKFGSRTLIQMLSNLGLCAQYNDTVDYEAAAVAAEPQKISDESFSQFVFDNADFNTNTLEGFNTFHRMGGIRCITPANAVSINPSFPRVKKQQDSAKALLEGRVPKRVPIKRFEITGSPGLKNVVICDLNELKPHYGCDGKPMMSNLDIFWMFGKMFNVPGFPFWNGFMTKLMEEKPYEVSHILCLPFVNLPPSSHDAVFTVLKFAADEIQKTEQTICFVTFDQPLYSKARAITGSSNACNRDLSNVVVRLGGFHLLMSFMGAIGNIMMGSGLKEVWSVIYAPNVAEKMTSGHNYSRALRGHLIVHLAVVVIILRECDISEEEKEYIIELLKIFGEKPLLPEDIQHNSILSGIQSKLEHHLSIIQSKGPTSALWIQYFYLVNLVKQFIKAERSGDWELHLKTIQSMIPFFHAAGHTQYAKSCHLYLQDMYGLEQLMPTKEYESFTKRGFFTIRRSEKYWSGLWTDLTIEQTLMRMMKSRGGLTRGRGMEECVVEKWILGMSATFEICSAMEEYASVYYNSNELHTELRSSRISRDSKDMDKVLDWFEAHPPFPETDYIMSIATGLVGDDTINCHTAFTVGTKSMKEIIGCNFHEVKLKRRNRVNTLADMNCSVKIRDEIVPVNTTLLLQRCLWIAKEEPELEEFFTYELSPRPLALFDDEGMRKTSKSVLYNLFRPERVNPTPPAALDMWYVVDGGFLIHRVYWPPQSTYHDIFVGYLAYVRKHYGQHIVIVFDGYGENVDCTKQAERNRRYVTPKCAEILFEEDMTATVGRDVFLTNSKNKSRFISMISTFFQEANIAVEQAPGDADLLIIQTALNICQKKHAQVSIVGEDIDLLVLLLHHTPADINILFVKPGKAKSETLYYSTKSLQTSSPNLKDCVLLLHAFSGCDTTSAFFRKGKVSSFKLLMKNTKLKEIASIFMGVNTSKDEIGQVGTRLTLTLYKAPESEVSLDRYRYKCFKNAVAHSNKEITLSSIPPTTAASLQHSFRVYHQIQAWLGHQLTPTQWGWHRTQRGLEPTTTLQSPAPQKLLNLISCNCSKGCERWCGCKKAGMKCSNLCGFCQGISCRNISPLELEDEIDETEYPQEEIFNDHDC